MTGRQSVRVLPLADLIPHTANVRDQLEGVEDLARSIQSMGLIEPLVVTEHPTQGGKWLILAGHRRHAGATLAGLASVPCVVRHGADDAVEQLALMLVENMQRHDLNPVEKAEAIGALLARGLTQSDVARLIGTAPSTVNYYVMLLELDEESREEVRTGGVSLGAVREQIKAARAEQRTAGNKPTRGRPVVAEPGHFNLRHPLALLAKDRCTHTRRPKISVACGQCWEAVIREDAPAPADTSTSASIPGQTSLDDHLAGEVPA